MVPNHLRAPYGVYFTKTTVRRPARGRNNRTIKKSFIGHRTVLGEIRVLNINGRDVQRKNVVNNVDKSSLRAP